MTPTENSRPGRKFSTKAGWLKLSRIKAICSLNSSSFSTKLLSVTPTADPSLTGLTNKGNSKSSSNGVSTE